MSPQTSASALPEVENGLAGVATGLVHHSPLVAAQVLVAGEVFQVGAVGEEQQRLGVVGLVEAALGEQGAVQAAASRQPQQPFGEHRYRAVVAAFDLGRVAVGRLGECVAVGAAPGFLLVGGGGGVGGQRGGQ